METVLALTPLLHPAHPLVGLLWSATRVMPIARFAAAALES
jgi:hypothetical protein